MGTVFANGRSITHKGDGQTNIAAPPDVCKTPSPAGPVPIPYVNIAMTSNLASGSTKVEIEGNPVALKSSNISTSSGDEGGTAGGGIISSKFKGKMTWTSSSLDVKVEGKEVVRFMDVTMHNGNTGNTVFMELGAPSYAADFTGECPICGKSHDDHPQVEDQEARPTAKHVTDLVKKLKDDHTLGGKKEVAALEAEKKVITAHEKAANKPIPPTSLDEEKKAIIKARESLKQERQRINARIKAINEAPFVATSGKPSYMVGIMMCESHVDKKFATASGDNLPGFERVAKEQGFEIVSKGRAGPADYQKKNSMLNDPEKMAKFQGIWDKAALDRAELGAPEPGVCAAQKLLSEPGHQPVAMTEAFFASTEDIKLNFKHIRDAEGFATALQVALAVNWTAVREREYKHESIVPSCRTCQVLLPFLMCDKKATC